MTTPLSDAERIFTDRYTAGVARTFVFIAVIWHVGNDLVATIAGGLHPVAVVTWTAYAAVVAVGVPLVLRGRSAGPVVTGVGCVVLLAGSAAMHAVQPDSLFVFPNWAWQAAGWMALLLFWNRAAPGFMVFVVANSALSTAALLGKTENPAQSNKVQVSRPSDILAAQAAADLAFTGLLVGLGAVALLVGGIGVVNTMVISVLERRAEIGLRRSQGATRGHIRMQFLSEALLLSSLGGGAGVAIGSLVTIGYAALQDWPVAIPLWAIVGGMSATLVIGGIGGLYPAMRAARLAPTEALTSA